MEQCREIALECLGGLYSVKGAARRLGMSYDALDARIRRWGVQVYRLGNERMVRLSDVRLTGPSGRRAAH